ncbi:hypothetical protein V6N13_079068 [Hibiscus sabdariffa]
MESNFRVGHPVRDRGWRWWSVLAALPWRMGLDLDQYGAKQNYRSTLVFPFNLSRTIISVKIVISTSTPGQIYYLLQV